MSRLLASIWLLVCASIFAAAAPAAAHLTPNSEVRLDAAGDKITADIIVPLGEYGFATGNPVRDDPQARAMAGDYLQSRFRVAAPDGRLWAITLRDVEFVRIAGPPDLHATAVLTPPAGAPADRFAIEWRAVVDRLPSHFALFLLESAQHPGDRTIIGAVRGESPLLQVTVADHGLGAVFLGAVRLGMHHILGGYDHLLFLLTLLLPAPLLARGGVWRGSKPVRRTLSSLAWIVSAFTLGHSATLVGATLGGWRLPTAPVEIAIAVSVLVSAVHALRPLLPGREPLVVLLFGMVHGLAFATLIQQAHAGMASSATSLAGFNIGIELVQLGIVGAVAPALLALSRTRLYGWIRPTFAYACATAALMWIANRSLGVLQGEVAAMEQAMAWLRYAILAAAMVPAATLLSRRFGHAENEHHPEHQWQART